MSRTRALTLPHGALTGENLERNVELRVPTGIDELHVLQAERTRAERISALLERCVVRIGAHAPAPGAVRSLVAGDREALLLHLRALTFGGRLDCVLDCPTCAEPMDLDLSIEDLLVDPYTDPREEYETVLDDGRVIRFRLPTGDDLQEVARLGLESGQAAAVLLQRCIIEPAAPQGSPATPETHETLSRRMADLDPQAELRLVMACPECGGDVSAVLDAAGPILDELAPSTDELYAELHSLALHYHWTERDILALEVPSRRRYLALIADSVANGAVA